MPIIFMKKLKHLVLTLTQRLKRKQKTSQLLDTEINLKFSKGDRVTIVTRAYDDLKYRTGEIVAGKESTPDLNVYKVSLDLYPSSYQLKQHLIPILFAEEELVFEDNSKERDWKLKQVLK
jgi:hypothetical protein